MPSTDRRLELKEKTSMVQTVWQPVVYAKGLTSQQELQCFHPHTNNCLGVYKCSNLHFVSGVKLWIAHRLVFKKYRCWLEDEPGH